MPVIHYAIEILFPDLEVDDATIGMVNDGCPLYSSIRLITDRPGYDGVAHPHPTWEDTSTNDAIWYEDFITKDGLSNPSRRVDLTGTGDYGTLSGFDFTIENTMVAGSTDPFWKRAQAAGCHWVNKTVRLYVVIDNVFYQAWEGVIANNPYNETDFKCVCKSDFTSVHKPLPPQVISDTNYPNAISESKGKSIPVCFGYVPYAQLLNVDGLPQYSDCQTDDFGNVYKTCMAAGYYDDGGGIGRPFLVLYTDNGIFGINSLVGKYIQVVAGAGSPDTNRLFRIYSNEVTDTSSHPWHTDIVLEEQLGVDDTTFNTTYNYAAPNWADKWQFKIAEIGRTNVISNWAVAEYKKSGDGRYQLWEYSSDQSRYVDCKHAFIDGSWSDGPQTVETTAKIIDTDGNINYMFPLNGSYIVGESYQYINEQSLTKTGSLSNIADLSRATTYKIESAVSSCVAGRVYVVSVNADVDIDYGENEAQLDAIYIMADYEASKNVNIDLYNLSLYITYYDQYGNTASTQTINLTNLIGDYNFIPNDYYRAGGSDNSEQSDFNKYISGFDQKTQFEISAAMLAGIKAGYIGKRINIELRYGFGNTNNSSLALAAMLDVKEFGIVAVKRIDTIGTNLYTRVLGEQYVSQNSTSVYRVFRNILENFDGISSADIDYGNLTTKRDTASSYRWVVGRQLTERKNSFEYLKELCADSFVALFNSRTGKKTFSAWLDDRTVAFTHTQANILRGSIDSFEKTQSTDLYNDFYIKYAYSPGPNNCSKAFTVTKINQASFPAYGTDAWKQYCGGLDTNAYADAKYLWDWCHEAYLRMGVVRQFERELLWFPDLYTYEGGTTNWGVGADSTAFYFLQNAIQWVTREKTEVSYEIPLTAANIAIELCDHISFSDSIYTDGVARLGWIEQVEIDTNKSVIRIKAILEPDDGIDAAIPGDIIELGDCADTITETGSNTDTITEDGLA